MTLAVSLASASRALATDDYTLPFYDPSISLSYGVDRDPRVCYQRDWANVLWTDCNLHYGRVYDGHTGMDYPMPLISPVAASRDGDPDHIAKSRSSTTALESGLLSCPAWLTGSFWTRTAYRGECGVQCPPRAPGSAADSTKAG